jgi:hypothetical protein
MDCVAIAKCYQTCMKDECTTDCWIPYKNGQKQYLQMAICIYCNNCYSDCGNGKQGCPKK